AARALGRLHDADARPTLQSLKHDPVEDVRLAAHHALEHRSSAAASRVMREEGGAGAPKRWTSVGGDAGDGDSPTVGDWRAALRKRFGAGGGDDDDGSGK
ncbi:MAG TPA: HEAT repeat domain-containing protein, partial [Ktedonobacterales bacterium]|nr:HEAT repeat domain-containing protein [Ktedonobacterales bacterium]